MSVDIVCTVHDLTHGPEDVAEIDINPYTVNLIYLNFYPFEVVSYHRNPQLQVAENYSYLFNLRTSICKS